LAANSITVNPVPSAPNASSTVAIQCGTPTYNATSNITGSTFNWYTVASGGTAISGANNGTYVYTGYVPGTTNTLWVSSSSNGCEGPRTQIDVMVNTPPTLTVSQNGSVNSCIGRIETLNITSVTTDFDTYVWSPITNLYTDAAATVAYNGTGNPTTLYYKRSTVTTSAETITLTASNASGCINTSVVSFTVNTNPVISSVTASPATLCHGSTVTLNGSSIVASAGTASVGTADATASITGGPYRQGACFANKAQYLFTAAELSAAGIQAGNITALSFNVTSNGSGTIPNFSIAMANTSVSALTTTFQSTTGTTVFTAATYTTVLGLTHIHLQLRLVGMEHLMF